MPNKMYHTHTISFLLLMVVALGLAFPNFQSKLPNGDRIPHPCKENYLWRGLGHKNSEGGGPRNPFGRDFSQNGHVSDKFVKKYYIFMCDMCKSHLLNVILIFQTHLNFKMYHSFIMLIIIFMLQMKAMGSNSKTTS